jgi:hypothetical protein
MTQAYSNPERENDPHALPNIEVFKVSRMEAQYNRENADHADDNTIFEAGWYWWACLPGCLPDSIVFGPFDTEEEALADAQQNNDA